MPLHTYDKLRRKRHTLLIIVENFVRDPNHKPARVTLCMCLRPPLWHVPQSMRRGEYALKTGLRHARTSYWVFVHPPTIDDLALGR